jgi:hypothetical protein
MTQLLTLSPFTTSRISPTLPLCPPLFHRHHPFCTLLISYTMRWRCFQRQDGARFRALQCLEFVIFGSQSIDLVCQLSIRLHKGCFSHSHVGFVFARSLRMALDRIHALEFEARRLFAIVLRWPCILASAARGLRVMHLLIRDAADPRNEKKNDDGRIRNSECDCHAYFEDALVHIVRQRSWRVKR